METIEYFQINPVICLIAQIVLEKNTMVSQQELPILSHLKIGR